MKLYKQDNPSHSKLIYYLKLILINKIESYGMLDYKVTIQ